MSLEKRANNVINAINSSNASETEDVFMSSDSEGSCVDSTLGSNSKEGRYRFELSDSEIRRKLEQIEIGYIQVTLRKCDYMLGFEEVAPDLSPESLHSSRSDEGYSNKYETEEQQYRARVEEDIVDAVGESTVASAVGRVTGTESSKGIEELLGYQHKEHIENEIRCIPGESGVVVRFSLEEGRGEREPTIENEIEQAPRCISTPRKEDEEI